MLDGARLGNVQHPSPLGFPTRRNAGLNRMMDRLKRVSGVCLALALTGSAALAQTSTASKPYPNKSKPKRIFKTQQSQAENLREQHLRVFRKHILTRTLDQIKGMNEAGLRLSARNQILVYLSESKAGSEDDKPITTRLALEALTDFGQYSEDLLPLMADYLLSDLGAWIQKHRPELKEKFEAVVKVSKNSKDASRIRALFDLRNGDALAVKRLRELLQQGRDLDSLIFWLEELRKLNSKEFEPLLSEIVTLADRGPVVSFDTLFSVAPVYFHPETPGELQRRFLTMVLSRTQGANLGVEPVSQRAYELLSTLLPTFQQIMPESYEQALTQNLTMQATLTESEKAIVARTKRLEHSLNPIEDLLTEADGAKTKNERNEILAEAAQLALRKSKFAVTLEIIDKLDPAVAAMSPGFWENWKDQFLTKFVITVLAAREPDLALKASSRVGSTLVRVEALVAVIRYWVGVKQKNAAQDALTEANKIASAGSNDIEKAKAFFLLSLTCDPVDESRKAELLHSGIKALNNFSPPDVKANDRETYQQYVRTLDNTGYQVTKAFKQLIKKDENGALALVEDLQTRDVRAFAFIGILLGLDDLLAVARVEASSANP